MEKYTNVYSFFGADSTVGTTMVTTSIGNLLSKGNKVLVIHANKKYGLDYYPIHAESQGVEELQNKLDSNILVYEDLTDILLKYEKLDIIPGVRNIERTRYFQVEDMDKILKVVHDRYDVILIDAGSEYEYNALSIGALNSTNHTVLVTTQQEKVRVEMERTLEISKRLGIEFNELIVNKDQGKQSGIITLEDLEKLSETKELLGVIPMSPYSWQAEYDRNSLNELDSDVKKAFTRTADKIAYELGLETIMSSDEKKGFNFFGLGGDRND